VKTFELISTQINSKLGATYGAPNGHKDKKKILNSKADNEDLGVDSTQINSKLKGYTHWVQLRCT
jgi:hypothetical protein